MVDVTEPIVDYLSALERSLRCPAGAKAKVLAEVEDHLREAAEHLEATGLSLAAAERRAVAAFGQPDALAADLRRGVPAKAPFAAVLAAVAALVLTGLGPGVQSNPFSEAAPLGVSFGWANPADPLPLGLPANSVAGSAPAPEEAPMGN